MLAIDYKKFLNIQMYNVYNKSNVYFVFQISKNKSYLIGDKEDLIKFLSKGVNTYGYSDSSRWSNDYVNNQNMGNDVITYRTFFNGYYFSHFIKRDFIFYDGLDRIIDVRDFVDEVYIYYKQHENDKIHYNFHRYYYMGQRSHAKNLGKGTFPNGAHQAKIIDSMKEYSEYNLKKIEDTNNPYPDFWDDVTRRVEGNWKTQYKTNKQYNIHSSSKDNKSIRKDFYDEDTFDIDELLEEDFMNNL